MKLHRFEEIWLVFAVIIIIGSMIVTGYQTFALGMGPPSHKETIDPQNVDNTAPFNEPGVYEVGDNEYDVVMTLEAFNFNPGDFEVPAGAKVNFIMTSKDVVHGIQIVDTNVNAMVMPGHIQTISQTFNEPGEYLVLCNEYCGVGHQLMSTTITVTD
ncbi:MAG TPA: cytochrome c oxidase subunit II [Pseudogracilibacillus sp.]|nr:cytochrome c oxidase subunit II [Pseudogracilibacillus sp.]